MSAAVTFAEGRTGGGRPDEGDAAPDDESRPPSEAEAERAGPLWRQRVYGRPSLRERLARRYRERLEGGEKRGDEH